MERRSFLSTVASSPLFTYLSELRIEKKKNIYHVEEIYGHYTDYRQEIEYRFEEGPIHTKPFENREYDEWFSTVSRDARNQECSVPVLPILPNCDLRAIRVAPTYSKSVFDTDEYEIYTHCGNHNKDSTFLVQHHEKGDMENMKSFEADSRMEINAKLDRRNVIF